MQLALGNRERKRVRFGSDRLLVGLPAAVAGRAHHSDADRHLRLRNQELDEPVNNR